MKLMIDNDPTIITSLNAFIDANTHQGELMLTDEEMDKIYALKIGEEITLGGMSATAETTIKRVE